MKYGIAVLFALFVGWPTISVSADSFLTAQQFPETFNDLSFTDRLQVMADGYAPWESEYNSDKICIKNCPYGPISIQKEIDRIEAATAEARLAASKYNQKYRVPVKSPVVQNAPITNKTSVPNDPAVLVPVKRQCTSFNPEIPLGQEIPYGKPMMGQLKITSPYGERTIYNKSENHRAIDFATPIGTDVFATANGVVENVSNDARCGLGIRIKHADGFATQYCHLSQQLVKPGESVQAGCLIAKSGNSGRTTGPHLHYAMYRNGGPLNPTSFIYQN